MAQILWLRSDLRLHDHTGFQQAIASGQPLAVVFILPQIWLDKDHLGVNRLGHAKAQFLRAALIDLYRQLKLRDHHLNIYSGHPVEIFSEIQKQYEDQPLTLLTSSSLSEEEKGWVKQLQKQGMHCQFYQPDSLISKANIEPSQLNHIEQSRPPISINQSGINTEENSRAMLSLEPLSLDIQQAAHWPNADHPVAVHPSLGERGGMLWLRQYIWTPDNFAENQDYLSGAEHLAPYISWGCLSPLYIWQQLDEHEAVLGKSEHIEFIRTELLKREYYHWLLQQEDHSQLNDCLSKDQIEPASQAHWQSWCQEQTSSEWANASLTKLRTTGHIPLNERTELAQYFIDTLNLHWRLGARWFDMHLKACGPVSNYLNAQTWQAISQEV